MNSLGCIKDLSRALFDVEQSRHLSSRPPPSPHQAAAARALATGPGAPSRAGGSFLPLHPARGPPGSTKVGRLVAEEGDTTASPTCHLPCSKTTSGELPTSSQSYGKKPR
jgi:hypothetical protein